MVVLSVAFLGLAVPFASARVGDSDSSDRGYGAVRIGGFFVTQFNTSIVARTEGVPLGLIIDFDRDLGLSDSVLVPRLFFNYRFSRRHRMGFDVFNTRRDSTVVLDEEIQIGDEVIPIGATFTAMTDVTVYKAVYTWLFHDSE